MRVLTYSQGLRIDDPALLATLAIFCEKTWLPYQRVGDTMQKVLEEEGALPNALAALQKDPARDAIRAWDASYDDLFSEQIFERLPGPSAVDHSAHRDDFSDKSVAEIVGEPKSIYERLALRFHFGRGDLPGTEVFDSGVAHSEINLAQSVIFLNIPKLSPIAPKKMLDLRADVQAHGLKEFWEIIEHEYRLAQAQGQHNVARAEKIRADFDKWTAERTSLAGVTVGLGLVTTLAAYIWGATGVAAAGEGILLGAAASTVPSWFGPLNAWRVGFNKSRNKAFKCVSRIDRRIG
ncbi:MAG TPA: hypothetical protein VGM07_08100 [Stellaceae bacterium]|jgi:hypothetical protein